MIKGRFTARFLFFLPVLFWGLSLGLWAQEAVSAGTGTGLQNPQNSESALGRLIEISSQLSALNERLQNELQGSRQNSRELQSMLETSRRELNTLRQELEVLRISSMELLIKAENSQEELTALETVLRKAESSLTSLELSFAAYKEAAERRINVLSRENRLWKWGCAAAGVLAAGFGTAFLAGR